MRVDEEIYIANEFFNKHISNLDISNRGFVSQNILSQLRTFVEAIVLKIHADGENVEKNYNDLKSALKSIRTNGKMKFLYNFHALLQKSTSHYILSEDGSERLLLKYYEYLLNIKIFLSETYQMEVLNNIEEFPIKTDSQLKEFHEKIVAKINNTDTFTNLGDRYYISKIKPFFINQRIYYEVTFTPPTEYGSKFDRMIAFTKLDLLSNYAAKLGIRTEKINMFGNDIEILIIDKYEVSIRPCEFNNFAKILRLPSNIQSGNSDYRKLMQMLTNSKINLLDIVTAPSDQYTAYTLHLKGSQNSSKITEILNKTRDIITTNKQGSNILRYLLYNLNNKIIKKQYSPYYCNLLSNLKLEYGCIPFDQMPFATSLINHNPKVIDLLECIESNDREHEFLARYIKNNVEINGEIYTPLTELAMFEDLPSLISKYNSLLYYKHKSRSLKLLKEYIYIQKYEEDILAIIRNVMDLNNHGIEKYNMHVKEWKESYTIDCEKKNQIIDTMFENSKVALIYGAAGTGKSTMVNHISNFFGEKEKLFLANTNPAVENLRLKVKAENTTFLTIAKFINNYSHYKRYYDVLVIDECSTVSNKDFIEIFRKANFEILVLVGDVYQIESIIFGNWFEIVKEFVPKTSVFELFVPRRTSDQNLIDLWKKVRDYESDIQEHMAKNQYSTTLNSTIFNEVSNDEIILCLNYDGLYGINNLNRILQANNKGNLYKWGVYTYKVGDPILFNESNRFAPVLYNNLKGKIIDIETDEITITFTVEVERYITVEEAKSVNLLWMSNIDDKNTVLKFKVSKYSNSDDDDESIDNIVPFQVAYAISIHKAQGLEFDSVKIIITDEVDDMVTHNIFYTAITRARKNLKIYWSSETETKIISSYEKKKSNSDVHLLKMLMVEA